MISAGRFTAYLAAFGSNPPDFFGWEGNDVDILFAQETSPSGQFTQQWKLRKRSQEAALKEGAKSKLRRLLAYNESFHCMDIAIGDSVPFYTVRSRKRSSSWREPAKIPTIDETGAAKTFQSQTFKVAPYCVRKRLDGEDAHEEERQT